MYRPLSDTSHYQSKTSRIDRRTSLWYRKKDSTLTASKATREFDIKVVIESLSKPYIILAERNGTPSLKTAVSVQIEAKESAITGGVW